MGTYFRHGFLVAVLLLPGCMTSAFLGSALMDPEDINEAIKVIKETGASGCAWFRGHGNPPASQIEVDLVWSYGLEGLDYKACIETIRGKGG